MLRGERSSSDCLHKKDHPLSTLKKRNASELETRLEFYETIFLAHCAVLMG